MTTRRDALRQISGAALLAAAPAWAQRSDRKFIIAMLTEISPDSATAAPYWKIFRNRLRELGLVEGKTYVIESRWAASQSGRLPALAAELVGLKPDVIVVVATSVAQAARRATSTVPIVAIGPPDPVKAGLVASLAKPGGNLTGISVVSVDVVGKLLQIVRDMAPSTKSIAYFTDPTSQASKQVFAELQEKVRPLGMSAQIMDGRSRESVQHAFETVARERIGAMIVTLNPLVVQHAQLVVELAARNRVPAVYQRPEYTALGGLVSYGVDLEAIYVRVADYTHRILKGTRPADLPFELWSTYKLTVNLKAARAMDLKLPQTLVFSADSVIE